MPDAAIAFVTSRATPGLAPDDRLVEAHLAPGLSLVPVAWDDESVDWGRFEAIVLRSCWNYHRAPEAFLRWVAERERRGDPLWNPAAVVAWNADKRYLETLAARGVPVVPTEWLPQGVPVDLAALLARRAWAQAVVKPVVSASAFRTWRTSADEARRHQARLDALLAGRDVMVQPFVREVFDRGEWSFVFLGGAFSHAVLKKPRPGDFRVQEEFGGVAGAAVPAPALRAQAQRIVETGAEAVGAPLLYARVDGVDRKGTFVLMELELIEPVLFLRHDARAPRRFAEVIAARRGVQPAAASWPRRATVDSMRADQA